MYCKSVRMGRSHENIREQTVMKRVSRRGVLAATAASGAAIGAKIANAASFGNPDQPPQGAVNATNKQGLTIPGPHDEGLASTMPTFLDPPPTDVGSMPEFWACLLYTSPSPRD